MPKQYHEKCNFGPKALQKNSTALPVPGSSLLYIYSVVSSKALVPLTTNLMRVRFTKVSTVKLTILLAEKEVVHEDFW